LHFGGEVLKTALHTPGHTAGSMSFAWRDHVFTGDTLLISGCGRTDFQSGSAEALYEQLTQVLFKLPDATTVWPGHDYQGRTHSSIGPGKRGQRPGGGKSLSRVCRHHGRRCTCPRPKRIDEAVPANAA
jgi:sulfur dioxygenase